MTTSQDSFHNSDEIRLREAFYAEHGPHLPDDLCLCVANLPTKWEVGPAFDEASEDLPLIDEDLLADVRNWLSSLNRS